MKLQCTVSWFACLNVTFTHDKTFLYVFCRFGFLRILTVGSDGHGHGNTWPSEADPRPAEQTGSRVEPNRKSAVTNCQTLSSDISPCLNPPSPQVTPLCFHLHTSSSAQLRNNLLVLVAFDLQPLYVRDWELKVHFKIHGQGKKNFNGDGMAIWLTKNRMQNGTLWLTHSHQFFMIQTLKLWWCPDLHPASRLGAFSHFYKSDL